MTIFSEELFEQEFGFEQLEDTMASAIRDAIKTPESLHLFFQRYIYFNGYASSVISRLASSIAMSRYLFTDPAIAVVDEADRGFQISAEVMIAASDEGAYDITHRELAQLLLKTTGDYAELSSAERNQYPQVPGWLDDIVEATMAGYQGTPGDVVSLIKSVGFHAASEMLGDREYALLDKIVRYDRKGEGFDQYLRDKTSAVPIGRHRYDPWCYVVIHGKHEGDGAEARHFVHVLNALEMICAYRPESVKQITEWVHQGFSDFVSLQQRLFQEMQKECLSCQAKGKLLSAELVAV